MNTIPVDEEIAYAIARLVDDAQSGRRYPSHSELDYLIQKANLSEFDPNKPGVSPVGKTKRLKNILIDAISSKPDLVNTFGYSLLVSIKANGGFRTDSLNYVGKEPIDNLSGALKKHGLLLTSEGDVLPVVLDNLSGQELTAALQNYVNRAKKGGEDAALMVGTSKDLIEAISAHVITEIFGHYPTTTNFSELINHAFIALDLETSKKTPVAGEHPRKAIERNFFDLACSINRLRNKQGTGHGRPWIPDLTTDEAITAVESMGIIGNFLLIALKRKKSLM